MTSENRTLTCAYCHQSFTPHRLVQKFCSRRCCYGFRDRKRFRTRGTPVETTCIDCGVVFNYTSATKPRIRCDTCRPSPAGTTAS